MVLYDKWAIMPPRLNKKDHFAYMFGYPDGRFIPQRAITRAEATAVFGRLILGGIDSVNQVEALPFWDTPTDEWYSKLVGYMAKNRLIKGDGNGAFRPNEPITRAEFAAIAMRFDLSKDRKPMSFTDVPGDHWGEDDINRAVAKGWMKGYPDGSFKPDIYIDRAEIAAVVNRMTERSAYKGFIASHKNEVIKFTDLYSNYWAYNEIIEATQGHDFKKNVEGIEAWTKIRDFGEMMNSR